MAKRVLDVQRFLEAKGSHYHTVSISVILVVRLKSSRIGKIGIYDRNPLSDAFRVIHKRNFEQFRNVRFCLLCLTNPALRFKELINQLVKKIGIAEMTFSMSCSNSKNLALERYKSVLKSLVINNGRRNLRANRLFNVA